MASNGFILSVYDLDLTPLVERHVFLPIRIGRSALNDVTVPHQLVSEFHARVEHLDGRLCVRDLNSKNGVLVESLDNDGQQRVGAQAAVDLEPYGYEFLLSPLLRVRVRPANAADASRPRHSRALGSVLGNEGELAAGPARAAGAARHPGHAAQAAPVPEQRPMPRETPRHHASTGQPASVAPPPTLPPLPWSASGPHATSHGLRPARRMDFGRG